MTDFKKLTEKLSKTTIYLIAIGLVLLGIIIASVASPYCGFWWNILEHVGIFLSSTITFTLIYEMWLKGIDRKLILSDLEETVHKEMASIRSNELLDKGRRPLNVKVNFIANASNEVIELGEKLHAFTEYFTSQNESAFKGPIKELLQKNVTLKCITSDPDSAIINAYSTSVFGQKNKLPISEIIDSIEKLKKIRDELKDYPGKIVIYKYNGIMKFHMSGVDIEKEYGKMYISNYLNGISRADCPGFEIYHKYNADSFKQYKAAYDDIMLHSTLIP